MSQKLLDEFEIKSLLSRERYYRDTAQWKRLRDSWHPDASQTSINITWFSGDVDSFVDGSMKMTARGTGATHTFTPIDVRFDATGTKAVSESVGSVNIRFSEQDEQFDCACVTTFLSRLQKVGGGVGWRICGLEVIYQRDSITPVLPGESAVKVATQIQKKLKEEGMERESYKRLAYVLEKGGFKVGNDMPGLDDFVSVEKCKKGIYVWIE